MCFLRVHILSINDIDTKMITKKNTPYLATLLFLTLFLSAGLLLSPSVFAKPIANQLKSHASPYLAMHGTDPVKWQDWNESVVKRAQKENKLIFISSGYFSCHWCHVMQRESYKNTEIAKILNKYFIPVKVDRELNPALDARLIDFVEKTQGQAGWPLNVFITPEGYPLVGMTYVPAKNFIQVLNNLKQQWTEKTSYLKTIARQATAQLLSAQQTQTTTKLKSNAAAFLSQQFLSQAADIMDEIQGGFGDQNKFPAAPQLITLLHIIETEKLKPYIKTKWTDFLITTLDSMARQGLRDQINGGFYRYTVDPNWQIPHFEKMLYDNAQLAILYFEASKLFNRSDFQTVAIDTLKFLQTDMASSIGVIAASLSAVDKEGIEGGCYVWQQDDLKKYLTSEQYKIAKQHWKLITNEALESGYHLIQVKTAKEISAQLKMNIRDVNTLISAAKLKLKTVRSKDSCPIDIKPVAAWLGLSLQAFTLGAQSSKPNRKDFLTTADNLYQFIQAKLWQPKTQTLYRSIRQTDKGSLPIGAAGLEDYALIANGIYEYARFKNNKAAYSLSTALAKQAWKRFYKEDGWYLAESPLIKYTVGKAVLEDSPLPSPSAILIKVSLELSDSHINNLAKAALQQGANKIEEAPYFYASQIDIIRRFLNL